jgi:alpha-glucosidase
MYFKKYPYTSNFEFVNKCTLSTSTDDSTEGSFSVTDFRPHDDNPCQQLQVSFTCRRYSGDIYYLRFSSRKWPRNYAQSDLQFPAPAATGETALTISQDLGIALTDKSGRSLLASVPGRGLGINGTASVFQFYRETGDQFYGMGEKMLGLELSGKRTKFWNTDVWGDFDHPIYLTGNPDPLYVSIPYLIVKRGNDYIGLLLDNPYATFIHTDGRINIADQMDAQDQPTHALALGAEHGQPNLVVIYGPTLAELTCKLQKLVGVTPLPPAWALGYHQCRWGYESVKDLQYLNAAMDRHDIPCDGIWLDIEYMRGYRVFTFDEEKNFPELRKDIANAQASGRRIVPIIDPGVKKEPGYEVYDSGKKADIFCKNPQGQDFVGLVWPGETVFPDFSVKKGRDWWRNWVMQFAENGITAAWLDMNDPSTGIAQCLDMRFNDGKDSHYTYHNQYALGMAQASREGFQAAYPDDRPFLLSRSGFTGSSKYTAIWTGDNVSNYHYLKASIPCTLNLALSGIPFNGPDVAGFGGNATPQLAKDWFKAGFLFPFFRNHSVIESENQEPWAFDRKTLDVLRHYIQLRYKLRPYLYNLFVGQEETGAAILRPLFYDFADMTDLPLGKIDDQFMVGPAIMQAPFIEENQIRRKVVLPAARWYSAMHADWLEGGQVIEVEKHDLTTPLFVREGAILPLAVNTGGDQRFIGNQIECHIFADRNTTGTFETVYAFDDGQTHAYKQGKRSRLRITATINKDNLAITTNLLENGYGDCDVAFVLYDQFKHTTINGQAVTPREKVWTFAGKAQTCLQVRGTVGKTAG